LPTVYKGLEVVSYLPEASPRMDKTRIPILVIEDNQEMLFIYSKFFKTTEFQIIPARTLRDAQLAFKTFRFTVIISDILLETESTWNFLSDLSRKEETRNIPIIIITLVENEKKALSVGARAFHSKPVDRHWLLKKVRELSRHMPEVNTLAHG
jgi:DNA-binding response OmpR family regulator